MDGEGVRGGRGHKWRQTDEHQAQWPFGGNRKTVFIVSATHKKKFRHRLMKTTGHWTKYEIELAYSPIGRFVDQMLSEFCGLMNTEVDDGCENIVICTGV